MQFFEHQDQARGRTSLLVLFFVLAVLGLGALLAGATHLLLSWDREPGQPLTRDHWSLVATAAIGTWGIIFLGSSYRLSQLSRGGKVVAEGLGGSLLTAGSGDVLERRVLNVVEEMAIAAGLPMPPVYLLEREKGINAFAAGWSPDDAVIGVTRGALEGLSRDQLQGVIAHEFSHILHRDCALNLRLIGILHGILVISTIGGYVMRLSSGSTHTSSRREGGAFHFFILGAVIWLFGSLGVLLARMIQASVSQQREYLADASAVQFTRDPEGIAGALATIGSQTSGLTSPLRGEASHMLIAEPQAPGFLGSLSTHPPLFERISRLLPRWDGRFATLATPPGSVRKRLQRENEDAEDEDLGQFIPGLRPPNLDLSAADTGLLGGQGGVVAGVLETALVLEPVAPRPSRKELENARGLLAATPDSLLAAAADPFACRALIVLIVLRDDHERRTATPPGTATPTTGGRRSELLALCPSVHADTALIEEVARLAPWLEQTPDATVLPLFDLAMSSLAASSDRQKAEFSAQLEELRQHLFALSYRAYCFTAVTLRHLDPKPRNLTTNRALIKDSIETALSVLAREGHDNAEAAAQAFSSGTALLGRRGASLSLWSESSLNVAALDAALSTLLRLPLSSRTDVLLAAETIAAHDGHLRPNESELLRAIAVCINISVSPPQAPPASAQAEPAA